MTASLRFLLIAWLVSGVGCGQSPVLGELTVDGGADPYHHKMEPELVQFGLDQIATLTSETFWRTRVCPLLSGESQAVREFSKSSATRFSVSLQERKRDPSQHYVYSFCLKFRGLTRAEAETMIHAISLGYEAHAAEQFNRARQKSILLLEEEMQQRQNSFDRGSSNPTDSDRHREILTRFENAISKFAQEKPIPPVKSASIR